MQIPSGNAVQTWLRNMDSAGDSRLFVSRPSKGKRTPFYLDYFKSTFRFVSYTFLPTLRREGELISVWDNDF